MLDFKLDPNIARHQSDNRNKSNRHNRDSVAEMFDFFGLSRELRDIIYEQSFTPRKCIYHERGIYAEAREFPASNLMRVSRQFGNEYRETVIKHTTLTFVDVANDDIDLATGPPPHVIPALVKSARSVDFKLWLTCGDEGTAHDRAKCGSIDELSAHLSWIKTLLGGVISPRTVSVALYMMTEAQFSTCERAIVQSLSQLPDLPRLKQLVVAISDTDLMSKGPGGAEVVMEWDDKTGVWQRLEPSKGKQTLEAFPIDGTQRAVSEADTEVEADSANGLEAEAAGRGEDGHRSKKQSDDEAQKPEE